MLIWLAAKLNKPLAAYRLVECGGCTYRGQLERVGDQLSLPALRVDDPLRCHVQSYKGVKRKFNITISSVLPIDNDWANGGLKALDLLDAPVYALSYA